MLRIVYGLKLDCEVALWTRRIGWRDTTNNGGSELTAKLQRSNHQVRPGHDDIKIKMFDTTSGHEALGSQGPFTVLAKAYFLTWGERQTTRGTAEAEKIREEADMIDYNEKLVYEEDQIEEDSKLSGNPPYLEGGGPSVALCVRAQLRHYNNNASHEGSCALWRTAAAPQFAIGRRKALQSAKRSQLKRLQTQKDGYIFATDVRDSLKIQEVEKKEQSLQRSHGSSAIHDQETGQVHQVVSDLHIVSFTFTLIVLFL